MINIELPILVYTTSNKTISSQLSHHLQNPFSPQNNNKSKKQSLLLHCTRNSGTTKKIHPTKTRKEQEAYFMEKLRLWSWEEKESDLKLQQESEWILRVGSVNARGVSLEAMLDDAAAIWDQRYWWASVIQIPNGTLLSLKDKKKYY